MIKLTWIKSSNEQAPMLFIIPGGPGLSSLTMRSLDPLNRSFNLAYVDFPGTNENPYIGKKTSKELSLALSDVIQNESGDKYALGHSFGGFFAADLFTRDFVKGVICISTPFSMKALTAVGNNYATYKTAELSQAEAKWTKYKDDNSFAQWLSEYGDLYFKNPSGKNLLLTDKVSADFFKDNRSDAVHMEPLLDSLSRMQGKKIFISGSDDKLLPVNILKEDASRGQFNFFEVSNSSHFAMFDHPEAVINLISENILKSKGGI